MVLSLIFYIFRHCVQLFASKRYHPVFGLPTELMGQGQLVVNKVRTVSLDLTDEIIQSDAWRHCRSQVNSGYSILAIGSRGLRRLSLSWGTVPLPKCAARENWLLLQRNKDMF
jgi:hypothetical protein